MTARILEQSVAKLLDEGHSTIACGTRRVVGSNSPVLLHEPDKALLIIAGEMDVFAIKCKDGQPVGQRHALFRATAGEIIFGLPGTTSAAESGVESAVESTVEKGKETYCLLAVGIEGTEIIDNFSLADLATLAPDHIGSLLDRYIAALSHVFPRERPDASALVVEPGQTAELFHHMPVFSSTRRPVWILPDTAHEAVLEIASPATRTGRQLLLYGDINLKVAAAPVSSANWAQTLESMKITAVDSQTLVQTCDWQSILSGYLQAFAGLLSIELESLEASLLERQKSNLRINQTALRSAIRDMAITVIPNLDASDATTAPGTEPLHAVFLAVARNLKIEDARLQRRTIVSKDAPAIDVLALTYGVRTRKVILRLGWWSDDIGPLLAYLEDDRSPVALLPTPSGGYELWNPATETRQIVDEELADTLHGEGIMLYRPLPWSSRRLADLIDFVLPSIKIDLARVTLMGLAGGLLAAFVPVITGVLVEDVLPNADLNAHITIILALIAVALGGTCFEVVKAFALMRIESRADLNLQSALFDRILRLPAAFYRKFTAGDLTDRVLGIQTIRQTLTGTTVQSLLGVTFSLFSLLVLFIYNWKLAIIACAMVAVSVAITVWLGFRQLREERIRVEHQGQAEGFILQFLTGVAKLRIAAAEARAYARWAGYYNLQKRRFVRAQTYANYQDLFQSVFPVIATGIIFVMAATLLKADVIALQLESLVTGPSEANPDTFSTGEFIAFNTAFGQFLAAMTTLAQALTKSLSVVPVFERLRPVMETEPEAGSEDKILASLRGGIEINHVNFRYNENGPLVLNNLTLAIEPNEFVAVVGPSGSGKSTLVRLLLGFEKCEAGEVLFDGTPLSKLDITSVRSQIRVVLQNSQLVTGSVFSNIVGSSTLTVDDAWYAARLAGLADDIEAMPMGMHTVLMEGSNTISGGQRQRLMIARALVHRPSILLLDEPTSALDNKTQDIVMKSLAGLNATRLVIAHRLSTVRAADRIIVLEGGQLVQQGSFDELINTEGPFAEMAKRQLL